MTIPSDQELMLPILEFAGAKDEHSVGEAREVLADRFELTDEEKTELLPGGGQSVFRVGSTKTYPPQANLLESIRRGHFKITAHGQRRGLQSAWEGVKESAGLESISPDLEGFHLHDLRHHRISELFAAGVARQIGHTSLEQLKAYSHLQVADVAAVLSRLQPVQAARNADVVEIGAR